MDSEKVVESSEGGGIMQKTVQSCHREGQQVV